MLSEEQIAQYARDGYLVVPDLLTGAEVDAFLTHEAQRNKEIPYGLHGHARDLQYGYLATHPNIAGIAAQLLNGRPRIVQTMLLNKPPEGGVGIALHQDTHYLPNEPNTLMACWVAHGY